jgi:carbon storage regulator CsrA
MLVLTRKQNEQIIIGENVRIKVMMIRGNQVRLALEAPRQVPICRAELLHPNHHRSGGATRTAEQPQGTTRADIATVPAAGASLAATMRNLAIQVHHVVHGVPAGQAEGSPSQIRDLLQQVARLQRLLRDRGPENVLLRWLDSVQRQLEDLQHLDTIKCVSTSG